MKDYLNNSETKEMIVLVQTRNLVKHFVDGNVMTGEEKADLEQGSTFIKKSLTNMINRLGEEQAKKFVKLFEQSKVIVVTDSELEVLQKRKDADLAAAYEENKEYFELVELTMDINCKDCTKCFKDCDLYKHFDNQEVIPFDESEDLGNCKFAYKK